MIRSMYSGVSGIRSHQVKMDAIGNNISNVNTQGFKMSRAAFANMYNQTLRSASGASASTGGTNPMQIGLGVSTSTVDVVHTTGSTQNTDRVLDLAIQGDGFIRVRQGEFDANGEGTGNFYFTRAGNLYLDESGYLVTSNGMYVMGAMIASTDWFDGGNYPDLDDIYTEMLAKNPDYLSPNDDPNLKNSTGGSGATITAGSNTITQNFTIDDIFSVNGAIPTPNSAGGGAYEFKEVMGRIAIPLNFTSISIDNGGKISGLSSEGVLVEIGVIPLSCFTNPGGLKSVGDNLYEQSNNSGMPVDWQAGQGGAAGEIRSGALEMSNVDLSREFTEMIVTQRGYQANSRIITVSDTLLEELINLKR